MSPTVEGAYQRLRTQHVHDASAGSTYAESVDKLNSGTEALFQFFDHRFDHAPLHNNRELRNLALEYKDKCSSVLGLCSDLRKLASDMDWLKHGLGKTARCVEVLWSNAASGQKHGNPVPLFHKQLKQQWPQGTTDAFHADERTRLVAKVRSRRRIGCGVGVMCCHVQVGARDLIVLYFYKYFVFNEH